MHITNKSKNKITSRDRYLNFINDNNVHYVKNNIDVSSQNVRDYLNSLSDAEKNKISILDLNIYYYFLNNLFKKYISKKERIIQIINTSIALDNRHKAFKRLNN